ncbi:MAG: selenide, water dikinase SelD [Phaeovulum sp.]|uniref:selenide, water dikinase SelD n=1 Tax=Phaeovulum sp. TaxID=2934796 RepID=UPI0027317DDB|nr:selenide, water dikinase SelD [Phaeovulum sp.]MDP2061654.1 selenide, water dikinase SelD [Phaeovulum sp.]
MQNPPLPLTRDLVLIGGGHAHALVLRMWGMKPLPGVRLTLISPSATATYSGMLPGHVAGVYPRGALALDLVKLARHAGARLIIGRVSGIDRSLQQIEVEGRGRVAYDLASIDIGISAEMPALPGFASHAVPVKPLDAFADRWQAYAESVAAGQALGRVVVIGGGVAGVELALAAHERLGPKAEVTVIEAGTPLRALGRGARKRLCARLAQPGMRLILGAPVVRVAAHAVHLADDRVIEAEFILGSAATRPQGWLAETGLALSAGFVEVGPTLQSRTDPLIFAAGDIAHMDFAPRPKAGVYAVRQAPVLFHNLQAVLGGGQMRAYAPQRDYLKLIFAGGGTAVADKWHLPLHGRWLWRWKNRIDTAFMAKVHDLPRMAPPPLPARLAHGVREALAGGKPLCGGCGGKMAHAPLAAALANLPAPGRADVAAGAGDDAAVLRAGEEYQVITTDHMRAFTPDPWLAARIAAVHALGDVWAMGAAPQAMLAQVTLPPMSETLQARSLTEVLAAAAAVCAEAGADLVGGHTASGAELTLGFTATGLCAGAPIRLAGAQPGDALILTKPIGTGVVLAAEMIGAAPGQAVAAALASMCRAQAAEAALLATVARAMTDVTGFGLAGHLLALLDASGLAARVDLASVPLLPGALALAEAGHASSLLPANLAALAGRMTAPPGARTDLLADPQTAGGLIAAVPAELAEQTLLKLRACGAGAAIIGSLGEGPPHLTVT